MVEKLLQALALQVGNEVSYRELGQLNGIRNALISNFNPLHLRSDVGALWENFLLAERMKHLQYHLQYVNQFFWRTLAQQEIDYVEEYGGYLHAYEFKWRGADKAKLPRAFQEAYPEHTWQVISRENFAPFVGV